MSKRIWGCFFTYIVHFQVPDKFLWLSSKFEIYRHRNITFRVFNCDLLFYFLVRYYPKENRHVICPSAKTSCFGGLGVCCSNQVVTTIYKESEDSTAQFSSNENQMFLTFNSGCSCQMEKDWATTIVAVAAGFLYGMIDTRVRPGTTCTVLLNYTEPTTRRTFQCFDLTSRTGRVRWMLASAFPLESN